MLLYFYPELLGGVLAGRVKEIEANLNKVGMRKVKVVEEGGRQTQDMLVIKNPLRERLCDTLDSQVCISATARGGGGGSRSVVYSSTYTACEVDGIKSKYFGKTSGSTYIRAKQHLRDVGEKLSNSHMYQHQVAAHPERSDSANLYRFDIVERHKSDFSRQLAEAIIMINSRCVN